MLSELETALDEESDVVVTLWRPFWANHAYPVKALEDPAGAFGEPESMHVMGRSGFGEDFAAELTTSGRSRCPTRSTSPWRTSWATTSRRARRPRPWSPGSRRTRTCFPPSRDERRRPLASCPVLTPPRSAHRAGRRPGQRALSAWRRPA